MASIKIDADVSPIKKSLLDISSQIKNLNRSGKVSLFSVEERRFLKRELNQELSGIKESFKASKAEVTKLVSEAAKLPRGSQKELDLRNKITDEYRRQNRLIQDQQRLQEARGSIAGRGEMGAAGGIGGGGGFLGGVGRLLRNPLAIAAGVGAAAYGTVRSQTAQYRQGVGDRVTLQGLGFLEGEEDQARAGDLARAGLTRNDFIRQRVESARTMGRVGSGTQDILQRSMFERARGLEQGTLTNMGGALRGQFGMQGANEALIKVQASLLSNGIEEGLGPYLETMTSLLSDINENGITQTNELISVMAQIAKDGVRTPEQIAKAFTNLNRAVQGSSGEQNAFFQLAFARAGIGGNNIGATQLAIEEGIFGLDEKRATERLELTEAQAAQMRREGAFTGLAGEGGIASGILDQLLSQATGREGATLDELEGTQFTRFRLMANARFGTTGNQGFEMARVLEDAEQGTISQEDARKKLEDLTKDEQQKTLDRINESISGQFDVLTKLNDTLQTDLGQNLIGVEIAALKLNNTLLRTLANNTEGANEMGSGSLTGGIAGALSGAGMGAWYGMAGGPLGMLIGALGGAAIGGSLGAYGGSYLDKEPNVPGASPTKQTDLMERLQKSIESLAAAENRKQAIINNVKTQANFKMINSNGTVKNSTFEK